VTERHTLYNRWTAAAYCGMGLSKIQIILKTKQNAVNPVDHPSTEQEGKNKLDVHLPMDA
jgi:hypothetical protein